MEFLHTVHCVIFDSFYNQHWYLCLFCLFSLALKKKMLFVLSLVPILEQQFNNRNAKYQTN